MVVKVNGKIVYGSWNDGSDIYKDTKGYYVIQWDPVKNSEYKKYLPKSWKPAPEDDDMKSASVKKVSKTKRRKTKRNKTKRNK